MTSSNIRKAHNKLNRALDPDEEDPWVLVDEAADLLENELK